jgi:hypothetical protein
VNAHWQSLASCTARVETQQGKAQSSPELAQRRDQAARAAEDFAAAVEYIVAVTTSPTINKFTSWSGVTTPAMSTSAEGYYVSGVGFPLNPQLGSYFGIDVRVDGIP